MIKIGTRSSKLALYQSNLVKDKLSNIYPELDFLLIQIKTKGDKIQTIDPKKGHYPLNKTSEP